ncbi:MAG: hypothetical protein KDB63_21455 [Nocardioidaceae bacterium]|nr:hypothetical protein [Nocardioidaceae bacterium]
MIVVLGALVAGVLTTLAPCVLPLLPVIVGGSLTPARSGLTRVAVVTGALGLSVVVFTLALKASTAFIGIDPAVWSLVAGGLLVGLGLVAIFPGAWDRMSTAVGLQRRSAAGLASARRRDGPVGGLVTGAALGPVFTSCSPMYGYVVVTVLPARPAYGLTLLTAYVIGLCGTLAAVALAGRGLLGRLGWLADPHGRTRRGLGVVFVIVGALVMSGLDRELQTWLVEHSPVRPWDLDAGFIPDS